MISQNYLNLAKIGNGKVLFVGVIINIWGQDYLNHIWSSFRATWKHLRCIQRAVEQNLTGM